MQDKLDILAFGAHPDDVELMCSGTMIKCARLGYRTGVISLTQGEKGTRGNREIRKQEFDAAAKILDVKTHKMLDIPDGRIEMSQENKFRIITELRRYQPDIVLTPYWETRHPDHAACSQLVKEAVFYSGLKNIDTGQQSFRPPHLLYYMELYDFVPSFIVDISDTFEQKLASIKAYKSQFYHPDQKDDQEMTFISSPEFLQSIITRSQYWGQKIGTAYGEAFYKREPIKVTDLKMLFE